MPHPHVIVGSTLGSLRQEILRRSGGSLPQLPLVFVPGFGAVRGWRSVAQKYFCAGCALPRFAVMGDWFIEAALASADVPLSFIRPAQRRLVLRPLLNSLKPELDELNKLADSNQFLQQLDQWMARLFSANVKSWPDNGGPWSKDLQFILQQYLAWQTRHGNGKWCDAELAPHLFARFAEKYPMLPRHIVVEGAVTLSPNECEGFQHLMAHCDAFTVALVAPGIDPACSSWADLMEFVADSVLEKTLQFWQSQNAGFEIIAPEQAVVTERMGDLQALVQGRNNVFLRSAHTPRHELQQVAQAIRQQSGNVREAAACGVIVNNNSRYADVLKSTFTEYGLPLRRLPGHPLTSSPLVQKLMQLLRLPERHWRVNALVDAFAGGALRFQNEGYVLNVHRIEQISAVLRQYVLNDVKDIDKLLDKSDLPNNFDVAEIRKDIEVFEQLQQRIIDISNAAEPCEWAERVEQLWLDVTAHWREEDSQSAQNVVLQMSDVRSALQTFRQSAPLWEKYFSVDAAGWASQLSLILGEIKSSGETGVTCGMDVTSPRQLVQNIPEIIYWPGMLEADFPAVSHDTLYTRHQNTFQQLCPHLPSTTAQSRYWLALALAEAQEIHFSWPQFCDDRTASPSVLLEEMEDDICVLEPAHDDAQKYFSLPRWWQAVAQAVDRSQDVSLLDNDPLAASVFVMYARRNESALNIFDGSLDKFGETFMNAFLQKRAKPLVHSASSLQSYAECGLKYFFKYVLSLEARPGISLLLEKHESGTLVHAILEQFYTQFHYPLDALHQSDAWHLMRKIVHQEIATLPVSPVLQRLETRRLIGSGEDQPGGMLGKYLLSEVDLRKDDWESSDFRRAMQPFGLSNLALPDEMGRAYEGRFKIAMEGLIHLEGKFDRLDASIDESTVVAVDYKTGKVPLSKTAPDGVSFQLPLYLWAMDQLFEKQGLKTGAIFYSLTEYKYTSGVSRGDVFKKGKAYNNSPRPLDEEEWDEFNDTFSAMVQEIDSLIKKGQFPISIREVEQANCKYCDYKNICFRNEEVQRRRREELQGDALIYTKGLNPPRRDFRKGKEVKNYKTDKGTK